MNNQLDLLTKLLTYLRSLPVWLRAVLLALVAGVLLCLSLSSCGQTVRVTVKDTPNGVSISTSQNRADSSGTSIKINPTINYHKQ